MAHGDLRFSFFFFSFFFSERGESWGRTGSGPAPCILGFSSMWGVRPGVSAGIVISFAYY